MEFLKFVCPITFGFCCVAPFAGAMIASVNGTATHNTSATDYVSEIWNRTVTLGAGTGTYLGNFGGTRWVLTAAHVSSTSGTIYTSDGKSITLSYGGKVCENFKTMVGDTEYTADLKLFSVSATGESADYLDYLDSLGNIEIYTGTLSLATPLYCVGTGRSLTIGSSYASGSREKQWGKFYQDSTQLSATATALNSTQTPWASATFEEMFSKSEDSIQCGAQDSGSGVFVKNSDGNWEAVGIALAVGPGGAAASVGYQDDASVENPTCTTQFAYLSYYADQIYAVIPEPSVFGLFAGIFALAFAGPRRRRK